MSEEKITGVCVDIPTTIKDAKKYKERCEFLVNGSWLNPDAALCPFCEQWCGEEDAERLRKWDVENNQMRKRSEWISVAERLPEEGVTVLVYSVGSYEFFTAEYCPSTFNCWISSFYRFNSEDITHWMPLPEPPKTTESPGA